MSKLYGANGGWAAERSVIFSGMATVYGIPYYQIDPVVSAQEWPDMMTWCVENFGASGSEEWPGVWSASQRWYANNGRFFFLSEKDLNLFLLRWK